MNTPIRDFVKNYIDKETTRAHMPGHKGAGILGIEQYDITEIKGADSLFEASSIIKESEENASTLFGAHTYYSTEGSSLCIRAMLYLCSLFAKAKGKAPLVLSARNVHKSFVSALAMLDLDVQWIIGDNATYLSCEITADMLDKKLCSMSKKPVAFYITSPDYLGNVADIKSIADVCKKHCVMLLVDNAHGAYLKFLKNSAHPLDLGATMCCDSAHKTLPVITGGAYLHIASDADELLVKNAKTALSLFASTSPSYLILQSLDMANNTLADGYEQTLREYVQKVDILKSELKTAGYTLVGNEPLKLTINTKSYGYLGTDFSEILRDKNIECEFCDPDFVVLMLTPQLPLDAIKTALLLIEKREAIADTPPTLILPQRAMSARQAVLSNSRTVDVKDSIGKILSNVTVGCPPAVPVLVSGEVIDTTALECLSYYGITHCDIVIE